MKILLFGLNGRAGMLHYTSQYANALAKYHDVSVVIPSYTSDMLFNDNIKLLRIEAPFVLLGSIICTLKIWNHIRLFRSINDFRPDTIQIMDNHPWYIPYAIMLSRYKLYVTQHDPTQHSGERVSILGLLGLFVNSVLRKIADKVIIHGESLKKELVKKGIKEEKIIVVPHGDYECFTKIGGKFNTEKGNILFFGRIAEYKGLDTLIKAFYIVSVKNPDARLIIAGEGDMAPYEKLINEEIRGKIEITNEYIADEDIAEYFQKAEIFVLPCNDATQSGLIPMAYAFRKPVIVTNVGTLPDVVDDGKTGYIVEPRNPEQLAEKIVKLLSDEKSLKEFGENGYIKMKEMMDWNKIVKKVYPVEHKDKNDNDDDKVER